MQKRIYTGIDIGTYHVKVMIAAPSESPDMPMQIMGTGIATSRGMRHGYIIDQHEAARSVREAVTRAKQSAKTNITSARVAMGGVGLDECIVDARAEFRDELLCEPLLPHHELARGCR